MSVATYQDVETAIGRPISDAKEQQRVEWWLDGAEMQIRARLGDVSKLDQDVVRYVVVEAVAVRLSNPDGFQSETVDDYTYRFGTETRQVVIREEWWRLLSPNTGAFSVRGYFEPDTAFGPGLDWS